MIKKITPTTWFEDGICMISEKTHQDLDNYAEMLEDMLDELEDAYRIGSLAENLDLLEAGKRITREQRKDAERLREMMKILPRQKWNPQSFNEDTEWAGMRKVAQKLKDELGIVPYYEKD